MLERYPKHERHVAERVQVYKQPKVENEMKQIMYNETSLLFIINVNN